MAVNMHCELSGLWVASHQRPLMDEANVDHSKIWSDVVLDSDAFRPPITALGRSKLPLAIDRCPSCIALPILLIIPRIWFCLMWYAGCMCSIMLKFWIKWLLTSLHYDAGISAFGGECQALKCTKNWILGLHYCTAFPPALMTAGLLDILRISKENKQMHVACYGWMRIMSDGEAYESKRSKP